MWLLSYWILPVISALMWLAMLGGMFGHWVGTTHERHYPSMADTQHIAYISDVGAFELKPLFITGCVITTVFLDASFLAERYLRHTGRLARNTYTSQKILSVCSMIAALAGTVGLICLSIFDTYHHHRLHDYLLGLFILGYSISAIFLCAEYQRLGIHYRHHKILRVSFWFKLLFIIIELSLAVVFGVMNRTSHWNIAAIVEWIIAVIFAFYVLSFVIDLIPSVRTKHHTPQGWKDRVHDHEMGVSNNEYDVPVTNDSAGPNQMTNGHGYRH